MINQEINFVLFSRKLKGSERIGNSVNLWLFVTEKKKLYQVYLKCMASGILSIYGNI